MGWGTGDGRDMIRVLIVEDDDIVAEVNKHYLSAIAGFTWVATASNCAEALECVANEHVDLVLLDIFMPGKDGLQFLAEVRRRNHRVDVIFISAASDVLHIQTALRLGAVDYLIKPFEFERFKSALYMYQKERAVMVDRQQMSQEELDALLLHQAAPSHRTDLKELPKGLAQVTLARTVQEILNLNTSSFSTEELAKCVQVSRISMRKYLMFLRDIGFLSYDLSYQSMGRPVNIYSLNKSRESVVKPYLSLDFRDN